MPRTPWGNRSKHTTGRICRWYNDRGDVVMITLDAWNREYDLTETAVVHVGPFDDVEKLEAELVHCLTAQGTLF